MPSDNIDELFKQSLNVSDAGFTESLMQKLPEERLKVITQKEKLIWIVTLPVVLVLAFLGLGDFTYTSLFSGSGLALLFVSVLIVFVHLESGVASNGSDVL